MIRRLPGWVQLVLGLVLFIVLAYSVFTVLLLLGGTSHS